MKALYHTAHLRAAALLCLLGAQVQATEVIASREISVYNNPMPQLVIDDAASREVTVFRHIVDPLHLAVAPSREVSAFRAATLVLEEPYEGELLPPAQLYFVLTTPPDLTVRISLHHSSSTAWTELYASQGRVPDTVSADYASTATSPDQEIVIPNTVDGRYVILIRATTDSSPTAQGDFSLVATTELFGLDRVLPSTVGAGIATLRMRGARFDEGTTFSVVDPVDQREVPARNVTIESAASAQATFDLSIFTPQEAPYDVIATHPNGMFSALQSSLTIEPVTPQFLLEANVDFLASARGGRPTEGVIIIHNAGNVDIPLVELAVFTPNDTRVELSSPDVADAVAQANGTDYNMGFSVLALDVRPGETRSLNVLVRATPEYPAHGGLVVAATATPSTMVDFRDGPLYEISETIRLAIVNDPEMPLEAREFARNSSAWWNGVRTHFDEYGFSGSQRSASPLPWWLDTGTCFAACTVVGWGAAAAATASGVGALAARAIVSGSSVACAFACNWCLQHRQCSIILTCQVFGLGTLPLGMIPGGKLCIEVIQAWDPNEKQGPSGFSESVFVEETNRLEYRVLFENLPAATAPAAEVQIYDALDPSLDIATFEVRRIQFGDTLIEIPDGRPSIEREVDLAAEHGVLVRVFCGVDANGRTLHCALTALDPETRQLPIDPTLGFLPPNVNAPEGEGLVEFSIRPLPDVPTGTVILNKASIIFDYNDPIETNEVLNTIDSGAPTSAAHALPSETPYANFEVCWSGEDDAGGSGIATYTSYVSDDGSPYTEWLTTGNECGWFTNARVGHTYSFYSVARDNVGHVEPPPADPDDGSIIADATTTITALQFDVDADHDVDLDDYYYFEFCLWDSGPGTEPFFEECLSIFDADDQPDGDVDLKDFAAFQRLFTGEY